jgi:penicillin-binding protein 1A
VIAVRLEKCYTKQEILTMYLNTVEFSDNAFGIKSAARTYFSKPVDSLKTEEAAVLVGMLKAPYYYNPRINSENSIKRRNVVLSQLEKYQFLSAEVADSLRNMPLTLSFRSSSHNEGMAPYFREVLRLELQEWIKDHPKVDGTPYDIYRDGLKIYTTIDSRMQLMAEEAVLEHMQYLQKEFDNHWAKRDPWKEFPDEWNRVVKQSDRFKAWKQEGLKEDSIWKKMLEPLPMKIFSWTGPLDTLMSPIDSIRYHRKFLQAGFMVTDPHSGQVKAWVGGINYEFFKFDHVTSQRQIGSTFKPFLYTIAIDNGWSPCLKVNDVPVTFEDFNNLSPYLKNLNSKWTQKSFASKARMKSLGGDLTAFYYMNDSRNIFFKTDI